MIVMVKEELMQDAMDINGAFLFEYDLKEDVISFTENVKKYIPYPLRIPSFLKQMDARGKVHPEDVKKAIAFFSGYSCDGKVRMEYIRFLDFNGNYPWYQLRGRLLNDGEGRPSLLYGTYTYMDEEKKLADDLLDKAFRDPLTRLYNKKKTYELIRDYLEAIPGDVIPNLMVIDIDDFANLKESYGNMAGDGIVQETARVLKRTFRASDIIGRLDCDEFIVCMKNVRDTRVLAERAAFIVQEVKRMWKSFERQYPTTVSVGVAAMEPGKGDLETLGRKADYALASAKMAGRDTYVLYTERLYGAEECGNAKISGKEMELVHNMLEPMSTWAYVVDQDYNVIYMNELLRRRIGDGTGMCYSVIKGYSEPCPDCPRKHMKHGETTYDSQIYSPGLRLSVQTRTITIRLRNGENLFIIAAVSEKIEDQLVSLKRSAERLNHSVYMLQDVIWDVNLTRNTCVRIKEKNIAAPQEERKCNYQKLRLYFRNRIVYSDDREAFMKLTDPVRIKEAIREGKDAIRREVRFLSVTGDYLWHSVSVIPDETGDSAKGKDLELLLVCQNIDDFKRGILEEYEAGKNLELMRQQGQYQMEIVLSNERYEHVNELTGTLVFEFNVETGERYLCSTFEDIFDIGGVSAGGPFELLGGLRPHEDDRRYYEGFLELAKESVDSREVTLRLYNRYGVAVWFTVILQPYYGINNRPFRYLVVLQDVNREMKLKAEMEYKADFDSLTGLYNCEAFYRKVAERMHFYPDKKYAMVVFDIDRFRLINDRYGVEEGNKALELLGKAIREITPAGAISSRYQGDMFQVMLVYEEQMEILDMIRDILLFASGQVKKYKMKLSFGVYQVDDIDLSVRLMCDRARLAQESVKGSAVDFYSFYDDKIRLKQRGQQEMEEEMQVALDNHEFVMYLQPKFDLRTEKMCGAEALVRWRHPTKGLRFPDVFLPFFENNGFITKLDKYMWEEACKFLVTLEEQGLTIPISVNISRVNIHNTDLLHTISELVERYGIDPKLLELEITESIFSEDVTELFETMEALKRRGFIIEMDDFGSGYSSLNMLRSAPMDVLKIDRFFLDEIMGTERGRIIVENSIRMAKQLNLTVVAEGVETREQVEFLKKVGCDIAQGYYYSKPIAVKEFLGLLRNKK